MSRVVVYGRPGCHLCDEALEVVQRVRASVPFALEVVDIERDDDLLRRHLERIPVVEVDGEELFELFVDEQALRSRLAVS
ncbi:MAG TPA: glutaredoxin family protein [Solirubrobacteraceae bacterium]|nr:glutaredoxin family protein [Solirubrobacteraceae bacterium]